MKSRILLVCCVFFVVWAALIARLAVLQVAPDKRLAQLQKQKFETVVTLASRRGAILDRHGKELATTVAAYSLYADPSLIKKSQLKSLSHKLARELKLPQHKVLKKLSASKKRFVWLQRRLSGTQMKKIKSWQHKALAFIEEPRRIYPNDFVLSQVLGFVGADGIGLEGLEFEHDDILRGTHRSLSLQKDARGRPLVVNGQVLSQNPEGSHLTLTLDRELQFTLEKYLVEGVKKHRAHSAIGVVLDAQTSAVLAMAHAPLYNTNKATSYKAWQRRARVVTDMFEPGSTFKIFTLAAALKHNLLKSGKKYFCEDGQMRIGDRVVRESDSKKKFKWLTASDILKHSSNIGTTKIALEVGDDKLRSTLYEFGFSQATGIDFPGEVAGRMHKLPWRPHLVSNVSFGHGVSATALQIANAYAAIANGGTLHKPYILNSIYEPYTKKHFIFEPVKLRKVLTPAQAQRLQKMLTHSAAPKAEVEGFVLAGKTGTAQKVKTHGKGYEKGAYVSSYAGFLPATQPRYVVYIAIDRPQKKYYAAEVAAPVFAKVARFLIRQAGLKPSVQLAKTTKTRAARGVKTTAHKTTYPKPIGADKMWFNTQLKAHKRGNTQVVPPLKKYTNNKAQDTKTQANTNANINANANVNTSTSTSENVGANGNVHTRAQVANQLSVGSGSMLYNQIEQALQQGRVPDLQGLALREVFRHIKHTPVKLKIHGHQGQVARTLPAAGQTLPTQGPLHVYLN